jgi:hypothetical protein
VERGPFIGARPEGNSARSTSGTGAQLDSRSSPGLLASHSALLRPTSSQSNCPCDVGDVGDVGVFGVFTVTCRKENSYALATKYIGMFGRQKAPLCQGGRVHLFGLFCSLEPDAYWLSHIHVDMHYLPHLLGRLPRPKTWYG